MKKFYFLFAMMFLSFSVIGQGTVMGTLIDASNNEPLIGASVFEKGTSNGTITDLDGKFSLDVSNNSGTLVLSFLGYSSKEIAFSSGNMNIGEVTLQVDNLILDEVVVTGVMDIVKDRRTPVAVSTIGLKEIQMKAVGNVEFPEAMKNTPSIYVSNQTGFGDSQMFTRGFNQINTAFLLNGQPINGMEDGRMYWSNWSGMSDVASAIQVQRGLGSSKLAISSVGGTINIVTKTTDLEENGFVRSMFGNDGYLKGTVSYSSGLKGKWAYSVLLDHWQANRKWAEGTFGQGQNYFFSVGFKPNENHSFNFLVTGAPQNHGQRWSQSLETLEETPKFNQHWGVYQGDDQFSERFNYYHKPVINLNWDWQISNRSSLSSVLYASFGRGGGTGNYGSSRNRVRTADGQIDWDAIQVNNEADSDGIGSFGSNYARRASVNNHQWFGNVTHYKTKLSDLVTFSGGVDFRFYTGDHFRQLVNLFGLNGYQDSFRHATRGSDYVVTETYKANPWSSLSSFAPEDQRIAYDYSEDINYQGVFGQLEYAKLEGVTAFVQAAVSNQSYQRMGRWSDIGESEKVSKVGYNVKGGASYSLDLSNTVFFNAGYYSRQPFLDNIFENIRYSNDLIGDGDIENESVIGYELGYKYFKDNFQANVNLYNTSWGNRSLVNIFTNENGTPDNEDDDFTQRNVERGIKQVHRGFELDFQYRMDKLTVKGYTSIGDWKFAEIESVQQFNDDDGTLIGEVAGEDLSDIHVPNAPQTSLGIGASYDITDAFSLWGDWNFYDRIFSNFDSEGESFLREEIGTLDSYNIFDAGASYRLNVGDNRLTIRANVYNLFDTFYINQTDPFGFLNGNGLTWNTSVKFEF